MRYRDKWPVYADQWNRMVIKPARYAELEQDARRIIAHKDRYLKIQEATGVPWYLVGLIHLREADGDFSAYLGNGDPLSHPTRHVPKNRGPFPSFEAGAIDALKLDKLSDVHDWRLEKMLYYSELFNGTGYDMRGLPAPYVWGGTNIQRPGKYVKDGPGGWRANVWDTQPGVAPVLQIISKLDPSVTFVRED